jgi:tetratricopeptide (TPR) repeat protein
MSRLADNSAWEQAHAVNQALYALPDLEPALRAPVATDLGRYYYHFSSQYQESVAALEESLALRRQLDGDAGEAFVLSHLAPAYAAAGRVADGRLAARRCVSLSQELNDRYQEGWGHYSLAEAEAQAGDWEAALLHLERSAATFQSLDSEFELGVVLRRVGQAQLRLRQWNRALVNFQANLGLMRTYDKRAWALRALVDICALYLAKGDASAIRPVAQEAIALLERNPNPAQRARLCTIQAEAALETDDGPAAAVFYVDALMALSRTTGCVKEDIAGRFLDRLDELAAGAELELARMVAGRVHDDIEAVLNGRLTRGGALVELDEQAATRLEALGLVEQLSNRYQ